MTEQNVSKLGEAHIEVVAKTDTLKPGLNAAKQQTQQATDSMKKGFGDVEERVTFAARALFGLRGTIGTIIAIPLVQAMVGSIQKVAEGIERIGYEAKTIGLTAQEFQKLQYAAKKSDIEMATLNTALGFFAKGLGQAQAGVGPLVETLGKIDPELAKQIKSAKSMQEALEIAADAVSSLATAEDRAAVTTNIFGRAGISMGRLMEGGAEGIRKLSEQAERLGYVLDDADIESAAKLADAFEDATLAIGHGFKEAVISLAPALVTTLELVVKLTTALRDMPRVSLQEQATQLKGQIASVSSTLDEMQQKTQAGGVSGFFAGGTIEKASQELMVLQDNLKAVQQQIAESNKPFTTEVVGGEKPEGRRLKPTISDEDLKKAADERKAAQDQLKDFNIQFLRETKQLSEAIQAEHDKELAKFQEMLDKKLISEDQFIQSRAQLAELTAKKMAEAFEQEFKAVLEAGQAVASGLESAFRQWAETGEFNAKKMINSILADLATLSLRQGVLQPLFGGGDVTGGGLFGSLLSGGLGSAFKFHKGGMVGSGGQPIMANPMLWAGAPRLHDGLMPDEYRAVLKRGEMVIPEGGSVGGSTIVMNIDARGAEMGVEQKIRREVALGLAAAEPRFLKNSVAAVGKARATRPGYLR